MKLIGYKIFHEQDNGETCEFYRIFRYESEIFTTKEAAVKSLSLIKKALLDKARKDSNEYINIQYKYEVNNNRSTNEFLCDVRKSLMKNYVRALRLVRKLVIVPVYARESPSQILNEIHLA